MSRELNHIHLFGNSEENFYALGKRDKIAFQLIFDQLKTLCARDNYLVKLLKATTDLSRNFVKNNQTQNLADLSAYAEGLEVDLDQVLFALMLPEMVTAFNKFSPQLLSIVPGCSSLFIWDKKAQGVVHGRILDYAMSGIFQQFERSALYELTGRQKVFSLGTGGIAFPSLSAVNESGLTLALHYKHNDQFNLSGESIFFIASEIMYHASNTQDALKILKSKNSMSKWGLYLSDKSGSVLALDICGKDIHFEKFQIQDHKYLYFNNRPLRKPSESLQPFGNREQCIMRAETVKDRMKSLDFSGSNLDIMKSSLEVLGKPNKQSPVKIHDWKLSPITPCSLQLCSLHTTLDKVYVVTDEKNKFFKNQFTEISNLFGKPLAKVNGASPQKDSFHAGIESLTKYQMSMDKGDIVNAYHSIQMAIQYLQGTPEKEVAKFYFYTAQYIYENDKRDLAYLYNDFKTLDGKLPPYLEEQKYIFLMRLEKILNYKAIDRLDLFNNSNLKEIYRKEIRMNALAIKSLRHLIFPRVDVLDIVYAY